MSPSTNKGFSMKVEKDIIYCSFEHDIIIDLKMAEKAVEERKKLLNNQDLPTIIDFREVKYFLQGAKDLLFTKNGFFDNAPIAVILNSFIIQTSINFALSLNPSPVPFKMSASIQKAEEWAKKAE